MTARGTMTVTGPAGAEPGGGSDGDGRWELLRALGAFACDDPASTAPLAAVLGLPPWTAAGHTRLFVLSLPPYASIYLGPEGKLGGEGADRVAGVWRALGLTPPAGADSLAAILALYAEAGQASVTARGPATRQRLDHARTAVLWEHLWPWLPGYLDAARRAEPQAAAWAGLAGRALTREARLSHPPATLPSALRLAPAGLATGTGYREVLGILTAPVRAGFILTHSDLAGLARHNGLGVRHGERRFILRALLEQDPAATLSWLGGHARRWARWHRFRADTVGGPGQMVDRWWAERAARSAAVLGELAGEAR
jgi:Nitrate reductase delta subunit